MKQPIKKTKVNSLKVDDYMKNFTQNKTNTAKPATSTKTASSVTTTNKTNSTPISQSLYQDYLNNSNATLKSKQEAYTAQNMANKYATDMLKAQGLANTGTASSNAIGIQNQYMNAINQADIAQRELDMNYQTQNSALALERATEELNNGMNPDEIRNAYANSLNESDSLALDRYIEQAKNAEKEYMETNFGITPYKSVDFSTTLERARQYFGDRPLNEPGMNKILRVYELMESVASNPDNNGKVVTFDGYDGYYVVYDGQIYEITKEQFDANANNSLGHLK